VVKNADPTPEEFDSPQLHREKVIPGAGSQHLHRAAEARRYEFMASSTARRRAAPSS